MASEADPDRALGGSPRLPPRDRGAQPIFEAGFRRPSQSFPGAIDRQHRNRDIERAARFPLDVEFFAEQTFDYGQNLPQAMTFGAANVEDARRAAVVRGRNERVDHILDKD